MQGRVQISFPLLTALEYVIDSGILLGNTCQVQTVKSQIKGLIVVKAIRGTLPSTEY